MGNRITGAFRLPTSTGIHFTDPRHFDIYTPTATNLNISNSGGTATASSTVAYFTELDRRGTIDTTDWSADTWKTIYSVTSGKGKVAAIVGPTSGSSVATSVRITRDGVLYPTISRTVASGLRLFMTTGWAPRILFTTAAAHMLSGNEALISDNATFNEVPTTDMEQPTWFLTKFMGIPLLQFDRSMLIEMKHAAAITNSTATAYSGVMAKLDEA